MKNNFLNKFTSKLTNPNKPSPKEKPIIKKEDNEILNEINHLQKENIEFSKSEQMNSPQIDNKVNSPLLIHSETKDDYIIEFENIEKKFKEKRGKIKVVHNGISFGIRRGETVAIIGANGAGKTVLMEMIVRIQKQNMGQVIYDFKGDDPFEEIGMQFQDADSNGSLTPKMMINFIKKMYKDKVDQNQLEEMINVYGIEEFLNRKIKKLSGGQRQRLNLLLATMHNPKLMILDEFITGLDIISVRDILEYIQKLKLKNDATLIIISHQPDEIKNLSKRIFILKDGRIQRDVLTSTIYKEYKGDFSKFLLEVI